MTEQPREVLAEWSGWTPHNPVPDDRDAHCIVRVHGCVLHEWQEGFQHRRDILTCAADVAAVAWLEPSDFDAVLAAVQEGRPETTKSLQDTAKSLQDIAAAVLQTHCGGDAG